MHRLAANGISPKHSGHFLVVGSFGAGAGVDLFTSMLTGLITKKKMALATKKNVINTFKKCPIINLLPLMEKSSGVTPSRFTEKDSWAFTMSVS